MKYYNLLKKQDFKKNEPYSVKKGLNAFAKKYRLMSA